MKNKTGLLTACCLLFLISLGGVVGAKTPAPLAVGKILQKTEAHYQNLHAFMAYFNQWTTSAAANSISTEASGILYYQKPRQMRWEYKTPEPQVFVANNHLAWLYVPSEKQISLFDAEAFYNTPLAQTFFDGIGSLKAHFDVLLDADKSNAAIAVLKLTPKKGDPNIKSLRLWIDLESYEITRLETQDALSNVNLIVLKSQKALPRLEKKLFAFDVPPATSVVDPEGRKLTAIQIKRLKTQLTK